MKYYLGIDGGGTKTSYLVIDENKKTVVEVSHEGTSIDTYTIQLVKERLLAGIESLPYQFSGVYAGLGGVISVKDIETIEDILKSAKNVIGKVGAGNDVTNALAGALNNQDGIILIAGTGSVAYGKNKDKTHRAGGYCYLEGDIGSAYYLGRYALCYLARVIDKRFPISEFAKELMQKTNCYDFSSLAKYIVAVSRIDVAKLAQVVTKYEKDPYALEIMNDAIDGTLLMINTVFRECGFKKANFSIIGGLGNSKTIYRELLLKKLDPRITYVDKKYEAVYGSALLAFSLD